jgi:hypothetical protein
MLLFIQDGLIEVSNAPSLGDIVFKKIRKQGRGFTGEIVPPGPEGSQLSVFLVNHNISMHHAAESDGLHIFQGDSILFQNIFFQVAERILNTRPDIIQVIGPDSINEGVFPVVSARGDRLIVLVDENRFNSCRTQLYPQCGLSCLNLFFNIHEISPLQLILLDLICALSITHFSTGFTLLSIRNTQPSVQFQI